MVRRWSYLNYVNILYDNYIPLDYASQVVTFKITTSYRRRLFPHEHSRPSRRFYARLKRLSTALHYNNILSNWSEDYLFFKKYNRFILTYKMFKHSYLVHNLLLFKKSPIYTLPGSENVIASYLVYSISKYFLNSNPSFFAPFIRYKGGQLLYITTDNIITEPVVAELKPTKSEELLAEVPVYSVHESSWYLDSNIDLDETFIFQTLISSCYEITFQRIMEIYKIIILLFLNKIL